MENIIITIISVNIKFKIIQTVIFEFENMILFGMSLRKTLKALKP